MWNPIKWVKEKAKKKIIIMIIKQVIKEVNKMSFLSGYRAYIAVAGAIIAIVGKMANEGNVTMDDITHLLELLALAAVRAGISKIGK